MRDTGTLLVTLALVMLAGVPSAWAESPPPSVATPSHMMTPQEYELYRMQIQRQIERANLPAQNDVAISNREESPMPDATERASSRYGQGYRSRRERSDQTTRMDARGNDRMHRGGGRNR